MITEWNQVNDLVSIYLRSLGETKILGTLSEELLVFGNTFWPGETKILGTLLELGLLVDWGLTLEGEDTGMLGTIVGLVLVIGFGVSVLGGEEVVGIIGVVLEGVDRLVALGVISWAGDEVDCLAALGVTSWAEDEVVGIIVGIAGVDSWVASGVISSDSWVGRTGDSAGVNFSTLFKGICWFWEGAWNRSQT